MIVTLQAARRVIWSLTALCIFLCYVTIHQNRVINQWRTIAKSAVAHEIELMQDMMTMEKQFEELDKLCSGK
jgi:hypothetical protein